MQAFPPGASANVGNSRTSAYSDDNHDDDDDVGDSSRGMGEHRDSLDRLQVSTSDRQKVSR